MSEKNLRNPEKIDVPSKAELHPKSQPRPSTRTTAALGRVALKNSRVLKK